MPNITLIKKLREETGSPMGDCNKALSECNDNYEQAIDWLRKKAYLLHLKRQEELLQKVL